MISPSLARPLAVAGLALLLQACANDKVWMRSGSNSTDAEIEEMNCTEQAERGGVSVSIGGETGPQTDRFSNRSACLRSKGFKLKSLSGEEAAKLKSLGGAEREAYWNELMVKNGLSPAKEEGGAPANVQAPAPSGQAGNARAQ